MSRNDFLAVFAMLLIGGCGDSGSLELRIVRIERGAIDVEVVNATTEAIVFLSPETPARQVDDERCELLISTKIIDHFRPYAFTPRLEHVEAGAVRRFRAVLHPVSLTSKTCTKWKVDAEYAYVLPRDVAMFEGRPSEDFRRRVLKTQKMLTASAYSVK
jgi:hypothetical protein